jgi:hypothetical protein
LLGDFVQEYPTRSLERSDCSEMTKNDDIVINSTTELMTATGAPLAMTTG